MSSNHLDTRIAEKSREFLLSIKGEAPSVFNKNFWTGKVMDWCMRNEQFKVQMFRFVDVLPYLNTSSSLTRHIKEYFICIASEIRCGDNHTLSLLHIQCELICS